MFNFIASSFFQKKHCQLPGIGSLSLVKRPAQTDFVNGQIKAPIEEILFTPAKNGKPVFNEFSAISELMIRKMDEEGEVALAGIGIFVKKETGLINFFPATRQRLLSVSFCQKGNQAGRRAFNTGRR